jgi:hypothetical protein
MVPQNPSLPTVNLTNMQREQIPKTVLTEHPAAAPEGEGARLTCNPSGT